MTFRNENWQITCFRRLDSSDFMGGGGNFSAIYSPMAYIKQFNITLQNVTSNLYDFKPL